MNRYVRWAGVAATLVCGGWVQAATMTWTNGSGGAWSVSNHWNAAVPKSGDAVVLPTAAARTAGSSRWGRRSSAGLPPPD